MRLQRVWRSVRRALSAVALVTTVPSALLAQSAINGTVRDTSGAVLPGVTVEASSPVLIEKVRTIVTNDPDEVRAAYASWNGAMVTKLLAPLSMGMGAPTAAVYTSAVGANDSSQTIVISNGE